MSWDDAALLVLAGSGFISLALTQLRDLLIKSVDVVHAWRGVRAAVSDTPRPTSASVDNAAPDPQSSGTRHN